MSEENKENKKSRYDKSYKLLLIIPAAIIIFSIFFLFQFNAQNGDIIFKDVSLTGGTTITAFENADIEDLRSFLRSSFPDVIVREITDLRTGEQQGFIVETKASSEQLKAELESYLRKELTTENSSIEFSGPSISSSFYQQLRIAVLLAFLFMAGVVFFIFKTPVPSLAVIVSAFADILMTIVVIDIFQISLSIGGIVALLMLIGYSVDTDILLTTRILRKREGTLNERMIGALKTGVTMTLTSIVAVGASLFIIYSASEVLRQIFTILIIGLGFDLFNTWVMNASILKWYADSKGIK